MEKEEWDWKNNGPWYKSCKHSQYYIAPTKEKELRVCTECGLVLLEEVSEYVGRANEPIYTRLDFDQREFVYKNFLTVK